MPTQFLIKKKKDTNSNLKNKIIFFFFSKSLISLYSRSPRPFHYWVELVSLLQEEERMGFEKINESHRIVRIISTTDLMIVRIISSFLLLTTHIWLLIIGNNKNKGSTNK